MLFQIESDRATFGFLFTVKLLLQDCEISLPTKARSNPKEKPLMRNFESTNFSIRGKKDLRSIGLGRGGAFIAGRGWGGSFLLYFSWVVWRPAPWG